jgi:SAM-dependent methyltransferase
MDVTNRYVLDFARRRGGRILDYGCGAGAVVLAGRAAGLDIWGADVFYEGAETRPPDSGFISTVAAGRIPFPDAHFDLVTNNQVMEHVPDLDAVLEEIHRVLKPGGALLSLFPSLDVWREGHIGIPFSHRFEKESRARFYYTWALRALGLGTWKDQAPSTRLWAADKLAWIDRWTVYRTRHEIFAAYDRHFASQPGEAEYIRYRLLDKPSAARRLAASLVGLPAISTLGVALFRKLAFLVIVSRKRS